MNDEFDRYQRMQIEIENNISLKFHQLLTDNLTATNNIAKELKALSLKVEPVLNMYAVAQRFGKVSQWITRNVFKIIIALGAMALACSQIWDFIKKK